MHITFTECKSSSTERRAAMSRLVDDKQATIFTRVDSHDECVAIVPDGKFAEDKFYWVWLTSKDAGSFVSGVARSKEQISHILVTGQWTHKPDARIIVEANNKQP